MLATCFFGSSSNNNKANNINWVCKDNSICLQEMTSLPIVSRIYRQDMTTATDDDDDNNNTSEEEATAGGRPIAFDTSLESKF